MSSRVRIGFSTLSLVLILGPLYGHGGGYRGPIGGHYGGPGDVTAGGKPHRRRNPSQPTTPGPGSPSTPSPAAPGAPGPTTPGRTPPPVTGVPAAPSPRSSGPRTPRGAPIGEDASRWQAWWEFNKDRFLNLRAAVHRGTLTSGMEEFYMGPRRRKPLAVALAPTAADLETTVLPALRQALQATTNRDIITSCLMALAKVGKDHREFPILPMLRRALASDDQEIRETAALAMGISQMKRALPLLRELALDRPLGRRLVQRTAVTYRTRSMALYGLGQLAASTADLDVQRQVLATAREILTRDKRGSGNVFVAAIHAIGLLRLEDNVSGAIPIRNEAIATLRSYFAKPLGPAEQFMQAHVPAALGRLLGAGDTLLHRSLIDAYCGILKTRTLGKRRLGNNMVRAAALALGQITPAAHSAAQSALIEHAQSGRDAQARSFAMISLGQIQGKLGRTFLLRTLTSGSKAMERPWAALALGIGAFQSARAHPHRAPDATLGHVLHRQLSKVRNPSARGAFALALGLGRFRVAGDDLIQALQKHRRQDEFAGHLCLGLALMDERRALPLIHSIVETSVRRPNLLRQAAIALGKMGDKQIAVTLMRRLDEPDGNLAKLAAAASALGVIGDRRTLKPLVDMLEDSRRTRLTRAFAAVGLGIVADKEPLPWNARIGANINYRANVETLTNGASGVLDIL